MGQYNSPSVVGMLFFVGSSSASFRVPDEKTVKLMKAFFANLSERQTKAEALRNARLAQFKARRTFHRSAAHPYYWAAFALTGE